jgi:hypothetical protein
MATAAELTGEEIAAVAESLSDPANLNVDTMASIMHRIGPGLMALGQKVLVALIIFLIGRKVISMIEKMLSRSMEHAGMDVGVTRFLRALTQFVMNVFLLFMIAGQLGMDSASIVAVLGAAGLGDALQNGFPAGVWLTSQGKILNATGAGTAKIYIRKKPKEFCIQRMAGADGQMENQIICDRGSYRKVDSGVNVVVYDLMTEEIEDQFGIDVSDGCRIVR